MNRLCTTLALFAALLISNVPARCGSSVSKGGGSSMSGKLASGVWGGAHVRVEVGEGGVNLEFDCAAGNVGRPIALDGEGRFDVRGTFVMQHPGPVLRDEEGNARAARYAGRVRGDALTLTVTLADPEEDAGTYTLTRGDEGRLTKCR